MTELREGWIQPDKHYIEHLSGKARITLKGLKTPIKFQVFIKSTNDWDMPNKKGFYELDDAMDAAETKLGLFK